VTIYLDVSCLNRPFDDQRQARIRLESEAVTEILAQADLGQIKLVSSEMAEIEINAMPDRDRRRRVQSLLPVQSDRMKLTEREFSRASKLSRLGFKAADAVHVAAAESLGVSVLLTCDDRLCRTARRHRKRLQVEVANPVDWLKEQSDAPDA
jgi:predicted nucleic acid-binding protein